MDWIFYSACRTVPALWSSDTNLTKMFWTDTDYRREAAEVERASQCALTHERYWQLQCSMPSTKIVRAGVRLCRLILQLVYRTFLLCHHAQYMTCTLLPALFSVILYQIKGHMILLTAHVLFPIKHRFWRRGFFVKLVLKCPSLWRRVMQNFLFFMRAVHDKY